jgi:hypothetical protein
LQTLLMQVGLLLVLHGATLLLSNGIEDKAIPSQQSFYFFISS